MNKLIKVILFLIVGMVQAFAWGGLRGDTLAKELDEAVLNRSFIFSNGSNGSRS